MRSDLIVVAAPVIDDDPGLQAVAEPFHGQAFIPEFSVKAFVGTVLPGFSWLDQYRFQLLAHSPLQ